MARKGGAYLKLVLAMTVAGMATTSPAQAPTPEDTARLEAMRTAADDLDEGADPAAYRKAWEDVVAFASTLYPEGHPEIAVLESEFVAADYLQGDIQGALTRTDDLIARLRAAGPDYALDVTDLMNARIVILMTLGRFDLARPLGAEILERRRAQYGDTPSTDTAAALSNYASAEYQFGNYDVAIDLMRQAIAEAERLDPTPPNAAIWYSNLPVYLAGAGRQEEAIEAARATAVRLESLLPPDHPFPASNLNTLAVLLIQIGKPSEAETTARRAVDIASATFGRKQQTASYMTILAEALTAQGKADEARTVAEAAVEILEADLGPEADRTLSAKEALAAALAAGGNLHGALALQRTIQAVRDANAPSHSPERVDGADRLAGLALQAGEVEEARALQAEAQALRAASLPADDLATLAGAARLGAMEVRSGDTTGLGRASSAADAADQRVRRLTAAGLERSRDARHIRDIHAWALDAALGAGDLAAAFRLAQRLMTGATDRTVAGAAQRANAADPAIAALLRERQDAAVAMERLLDRQLRAATRGADRETLQAFEAERTSLTRSLDQANAALDSRAPEIGESELPTPIDIDDARAALGEDEALLVAAVGPTRTALFTLTRDEAKMVEVAAGADRIAGLVGRVRAGVGTPGGPPFDFAASADLHALLFPEGVAASVAGKKTLLIAANGALDALPFALLAPRSADPTPRTARWLIRDHAVATLPSLLSLTVARPADRGQSLRGFVAVGAPALGGAGGATPYRSAANARTIGELPALPATAKELNALGQAFGADDSLILTGAEATEAAVREADLESANVVAFATHGLVAGELAGLDEAALVLTPDGADDGLLTASEIMRLRMDADWVVLSACNTAAGADSDSEGLSGLARAFLHAGGRNLLASHWAVRDDAAAYLSVETVRGYRAGMTPAEALRTAMLAMIDGSPVSDAEQPANWAPFVVIGR